MVRILCLHGTGANATIMKAQMAPLRNILPQHWEYVFPDAEMECDPAPGVENWPGPYYRYHLTPSIQRMAEIHEWLQDIIEDEGPFDGVFGFSAGGTVAASLMLQIQVGGDPQPLPFRFCIFCCSTLPWMASKNVGIDLAPVMMRLQSIPAELPAIKVAIKAAKEMPIQLPTEDSTTDSSYGPGIAEAVRADKEVAMAELERAKEGCVLVHPDQDTIRLKIPTLHVLGRNDDAYQAGRKLRDLCDARYASTMEHTEGHNVPRGETEKLKDLIEKTVARSEFLF